MADLSINLAGINFSQSFLAGFGSTDEYGLSSSAGI